MKKNLLNFALVIGICVSMSSCYTHTYNVGKGAQTGASVKGKNNYLISGLITLNTTNPSSMAGGAADYTVTTKHTFIDLILNSITFGIYSPTTTTVTK